MEPLWAILRCLGASKSYHEVSKGLWAALRCLRASISHREVSESLYEPPWGTREPLLTTLGCLRDCEQLYLCEQIWGVCEPPWGVWEPLWATLRYLRAFVSHPDMFWETESQLLVFRASVSHPEVTELLWANLKCLRIFMSHPEVSWNLSELPRGVREPLGATMRYLRASEQPLGVWEPLWATVKCAWETVSHFEMFESLCEQLWGVCEPPWGVWEPL